VPGTATIENVREIGREPDRSAIPDNADRWQFLKFS